LLASRLRFLALHQDVPYLAGMMRHRLEAARVRLARRLVGEADPLLHRVRLAGSTYTRELLALRRLSVPAARYRADSSAQSTRSNESVQSSVIAHPRPSASGPKSRLASSGCTPCVTRRISVARQLADSTGSCPNSSAAAWSSRSWCMTRLARSTVHSG